MTEIRSDAPWPPPTPTLPPITEHPTAPPQVPLVRTPDVHEPDGGEALQSWLSGLLEKLVGKADSESAASPPSSPRGVQGALESLGWANAKSLDEEQLYAAVAAQRLESLAGPDVARAFLEGVANRLRGSRASVESAVIATLQSLVARGHLPASMGDRVHSEAFAAAQLDGNQGLLFDGRGGPGDPTVAKAPTGDALQRAQRFLAGLDDGTAKVERRTLADAAVEASQAKQLIQGTTSSGGAGGFVFKPSSESDGNLVVLLPPGMTGRVVGLELVDAQGRVLEQGRATGIHNGGREHFRFDKPGGEYPAGLTVQARLEDGRVWTQRVGDPGRRVG